MRVGPNRLRLHDSSQVWSNYYLVFSDLGEWRVPTYTCMYTHTHTHTQTNTSPYASEAPPLSVHCNKLSTATPSLPESLLFSALSLFPSSKNHTPDCSSIFPRFSITLVQTARLKRGHTISVLRSICGRRRGPGRFSNMLFSWRGSMAVSPGRIL